MQTTRHQINKASGDGTDGDSAYDFGITCDRRRHSLPDNMVQNIMLHYFSLYFMVIFICTEGKQSYLRISNER